MDNPFDVLLKEIHEIRTAVNEILADKKQVDERLISPAETMKLFTPKISAPTLKKWADAGLLHMIRIGGRTWYKASEVFAAGQHLKKYKKR